MRPPEGPEECQMAFLGTVFRQFVAGPSLVEFLNKREMESCHPLEDPEGLGRAYYKSIIGGPLQ